MLDSGPGGVPTGGSVVLDVATVITGLRTWRTCWRQWNGIPVSAPKKAWFRDSETRASLNKMSRWFEIQAVQVEIYSVLVEPRHHVLFDLI